MSPLPHISAPLPVSALKRKSPPLVAEQPPKRTRFADSGSESSHTEPESETEPEPDDDMPQDVCNLIVLLHGVSLISLQHLHPRPAFARKPSQPWLAPMYLDDAKKIKVPGSINTFLRDYQREGVRFFWNRYTTGRGGLLGDDMGLVRDASTSELLGLY